MAMRRSNWRGFSDGNCEGPVKITAPHHDTLNATDSREAAGYTAAAAAAADAGE